MLGLMIWLLIRLCIFVYEHWLCVFGLGETSILGVFQSQDYRKKENVSTFYILDFQMCVEGSGLELCYYTLACFQWSLTKKSCLDATVGLSMGSFIQRNMVTENRSFWWPIFLHGKVCIWKRNLHFLSEIVLNWTFLEAIFPFILLISILKLRAPHLSYFRKNKHLNCQQGSQP